MGAPKQKILASTASGESSGELLAKYKSDEKFIAVVGPAGAGSGTAAKILAATLSAQGYKTNIIKVSALIKNFVLSNNGSVPKEGDHKNIADVVEMQNLGDSIRKGEEYGRDEDHSAVARLVIKEVKELRKSKDVDIQPDDEHIGTVFIIDSLRHPAEAILLREVYKELFFLIGVVCNPDIRFERIKSKFIPRGSDKSSELVAQINSYMKRDENAKDDYGQKVAKLFYEADYFVDNSEEGNEDVTETGMNEPLQRFAEIITHKRIVRPNIHEAAMFQAHAAQLQSACLSRQVGAAVVDKNHNIVATGLNPPYS